MSEWIEVDIALELDHFELSLAFSSGEPALGVFGPSGAGKSSFLEALAGVRDRVRGTIRVNNETWLSDRERRPAQKRRVGWVPQDHRLFPHWSVRKNLRAGMLASGEPADELEAIYEKTVKLLELEALLERMPDALSGGESQRVALGRALCSKPDLLILDEPISSMDKRLRSRILGFLREIQNEFAIPTIIVSHEATELQALCGEVIVLEKGRMVDRGSPVDAFTRYFGAGNESGSGEFVNVLDAYPVRLSGSTESAFRLGDSESAQNVFTAGRSIVEENQAVSLEIAASDILVSKDSVERISARNRLIAKIERVEKHPGIVWAFCRVGTVVLVASLTESAVGSLELEEGDAVYLLIKAQAVRAF